MLSNIFLIAMAVLVALGVTARAAAVESDAVAVTELEDKTIDSFIMDNDAALIMFYAPWCGHCKALEPEFQQAAIAIKNENGAHKGVAFGKIDATKHTEAAKDFGIEGFPTLHFYKQRKAVHYTGGRTTDTIISWLTKRMGPTTRPLNTRIEVDEWMLPRGEGDTSAAEATRTVGFFSESNPGATSFEAACMELEEANCGLVTDSELFHPYKDGDVVVLTQEEGNIKPHKQTQDEHLDDATTIANFVRVRSLPLVVTFTQENAPRVFGTRVATQLLLFGNWHSAKTGGGMGAILPAARKAAAKLVGEAIFVSLGKSEERIWDFFGITKQDVPAAMLIQNGATSLRRFAVEGKLDDAGTYLKTVEDFKAGKLKELVKSEEEPADNDSRDVRILTGNTITETVLKEDQAVLVEFYAPWCGHCKRLAPTLERVGMAFKGVESVVIAKMDSTANDSPGIGIEGFPTMKLFPSGLRNVGDALDVDGREFDEIVAFIKENAGLDFEISEETIEAARNMEVVHVEGFDGPVEDEDIAAANEEIAENEAEEEEAKDEL